MLTIPISVLMSVYEGDNCSHLHDALNSISNQSARPDEIVIVVDGPVPQTHLEIINSFAVSNPDIDLNCVKLEKNAGLSNAMKVGLEKCRNELVARMDSDDLCKSKRLELQWKRFQEDSELDLLCTWNADFIENPENIVAWKCSPVDPEKIKRQLCWRNPISHPTVMFKKSTVMAVGSYRMGTGYLEDHDLWLRMLHAGASIATLDKVLILVRTSDRQRRRRGGWAYAVNGAKLRYRWWKEGMLPTLNFIGAAFASFVFGLSPFWLKPMFYRFLRSSKKPEIKKR